MKPLHVFFYLMVLPFFTLAQKPQLVVPVGHTSYLKDAVISPDGRNVLTASSDRTAKLWNRDGHLLATLPGAAWEVQSVDFSPNGEYLLTCSRDALRLWNRDGEFLTAFRGGFLYTYASFSPDGKHIAAGSEQGTLVVWNLDKQAIWQKQVFDNAIKQVAYSPDGEMLAAIPLSYDHGSFKAWTNGNYELKHEFSTIYPLTAFMFSPDNDALLLGGSNGEVTIWDLDEGTQQEFRGLHFKEIFSVAAHPAGFLTASNDGTAKLFDKEGEVRQEFKHGAAVRNVTFSKDGKEILTFSDDTEAVKVWNLRGEIIQRLNGYGANVLSLAISPDGTQILSGSANGPRIWNIGDQTPLKALPQKDIINEVVISPDGQRYYTAGWDGTLNIWGPDGALLRKVSSNDFEIETMSISSDGEQLLISGKQGSTLYDKEGRKPRKIATKDYRSFASAFSPSGDTIITGSSVVKYPNARLWDIKTGKELQVLPTKTSVDAVGFSPDGRYILTHTTGKVLSLWNRKGEELWNKSGWDSFAGKAAFSSDSKTVLVPNGNLAILLDMNGKELHTLEGHTSMINTAIYSPGEDYIYTGSLDGTIKIWSADDYREFASLIQLGNQDWAVITPSGLFDASPEAMRLMYYTVDGEIVALDQLKALYYQPGLLQITMGYSKGATLRDVSELRELALYPEIEAELEGSILKIRLKEREGGMGKLTIKANGIPVKPDANPQRKTQIEINIDPFENYFLEGEDNTISIIAHDAEGVMESAPYHIRIPPREYIGGRGGGEDQPGGFSLSTKSAPDASLYALCVGTSKYSGEVPALRYPDKDADAMARALRDAGGALFTPDSVHVRLLNTSGEEGTVYASKKNIREAILEFARPGRAQAKDVLVLYFSGHGISYPPGPDAEFYYLTKDVVSTDLKNEDVRRNFAISVSELAEWMNEVYANKKVLILDACNSGEAIKEFTGEKSLNPSQILAMERMKDATGTFVLSGSAADKKSFEASRFGQGLLTYSLLQGMKAEGLTKEKFVDVMLLFNHAKLKVPELARSIGNIQDPQMTYPPSSQTVYLGKVTPDVKIPVAEEAKPVFVNSKIFKEDLTNLPGLENKLQEILQEESAKGIDAAVAYFDVPAYQDGFQIRSIYSVDGKEITFPGKVFHLSGGGEEKLIGEFKVSGDTRKLDELVQQIIFEAVTIVKGYKKRGAAGSP